jgi:hypothetical protein
MMWYELGDYRVTLLMYAKVKVERGDDAESSKVRSSLCAFDSIC